MGNDFIQSGCQDFKQSQCQNRVLFVPNPIGAGGKCARFLVTCARGDVAGYIAQLRTNLSAIMALMNFDGIGYGGGPGSQYIYDFDINPTFNIALGTLYSGGAYETQSKYYPGPGSPPNPFPSLAAAEAAMNRNVIQIVWLYDPAMPAGSVKPMLFYDATRYPGSLISSHGSLTSVTPPPDSFTPVGGSVIEVPIPDYIAPLYYAGAPPYIFAYWDERYYLA